MHGENQEFTKILVGRIEKQKLLNIVREIKELWRYSDNVWPGGDKSQRPQIKATIDSAGQYFIWLNAQGLTYLVTRLQNVEPIKLITEDKPINLDDIPF